MSDEFDFSGLQATAVSRLKARKIVPVPDAIVKLAQQAYDGVPQEDGSVLHVLELSLGTKERAAAFAKHMKNAGDHTQPISSVTVVYPIEDENGKVKDDTIVRWRAGARRGRAVSA